MDSAITQSEVQSWLNAQLIAESFSVHWTAGTASTCCRQQWSTDLPAFVFRWQYHGCNRNWDEPMCRTNFDANAASTSVTYSLLAARDKRGYVAVALFDEPTAVNANISQSHERILVQLDHEISTLHQQWQKTHQAPKLKKISEVYQALLANFQKVYTPNHDISVDESLMAYKGQLSWIQYIASKRARFGVKFYMLCESQSGYIWNSVLYTGKGTQFNNKSAKYRFSTSSVLSLIDKLLGKGYCVTMDNFYISPVVSQ